MTINIQIIGKSIDTLSEIAGKMNCWKYDTESNRGSVNVLLTFGGARGIRKIIDDYCHQHDISSDGISISEVDASEKPTRIEADIRSIIVDVSGMSDTRFDNERLAVRFLGYLREKIQPQDNNVSRGRHDYFEGWFPEEKRLYLMPGRLMQGSDWPVPSSGNRSNIMTASLVDTTEISISLPTIIFRDLFDEFGVSCLLRNRSGKQGPTGLSKPDEILEMQKSQSLWQNVMSGIRIECEFGRRDSHILKDLIKKIDEHHCVTPSSYYQGWRHLFINILRMVTGEKDGKKLCEDDIQHIRNSIGFDINAINKAANTLLSHGTCDIEGFQGKRRLTDECICDYLSSIKIKKGCVIWRHDDTGQSITFDARDELSPLDKKQRGRVCNDIKGKDTHGSDDQYDEQKAYIIERAREYQVDQLRKLEITGLSMQDIEALARGILHKWIGDPNEIQKECNEIDEIIIALSQKEQPWSEKQMECLHSALDRARLVDVASGFTAYIYYEGILEEIKSLVEPMDLRLYKSIKNHQLIGRHQATLNTLRECNFKAENRSSDPDKKDVSITLDDSLDDFNGQKMELLSIVLYLKQRIKKAKDNIETLNGKIQTLESSSSLDPIELYKMRRALKKEEDFYQLSTRIDGISVTETDQTKSVTVVLNEKSPLKNTTRWVMKSKITAWLRSEKALPKTGSSESYEVMSSLFMECERRLSSVFCTFVESGGDDVDTLNLTSNL